MKKILVCGGAGYIGSHMVKMLIETGHAVTVFDNLSTGHRYSVPPDILVQGDLLDVDALERLFAARSFDAVMHFSARSLVGESVAKPALYYRNNVVGTLNLLEAMDRAGVSRFVFSSSAAIFGQPRQALIDEEHPQVPINPYGETKHQVERILADFCAACGLRAVSLRYFNAAGADASGELGEAHDPETHLIPNVLGAAMGQGRLKVFGRDYDTEDGTCVRDYVHVDDLCRAHLLALEHLETHAGYAGFNLGNGRGFSILEVIRAAEAVTGREVPFDFAAPRPGDPATLVADSRRAQSVLGWQARYRDIAEIIATAWRWHSRKCGNPRP